MGRTATSGALGVTGPYYFYDPCELIVNSPAPFAMVQQCGCNNSTITCDVATGQLALAFKGDNLLDT